MGKIHDYDPEIIRELVCEFHKLATEILGILAPEEPAPEEPAPEEPAPEENYDEVISTVRERINRDSCLIGEIMDHMKEEGTMNEASYKQLKYVRNWIPKGPRRKVSTFNEAKRLLKGSKNTPSHIAFLQKEQRLYGNIVCDMGDCIVLSEKWKEIISKM